MQSDEIPVGKAKDLRGQKFGKLTPLYRIKTNDTSRAAKWHCKCDCGNECDVRGSGLTSGNTQSCGCLQKETASRIFTRDLTGQKFGKLTVLYRNGSTWNNGAIWHCKCDCGNEIDVTNNHLITGNTQSCGCLMTQSCGELAIQTLLKNNNIPFEKQKTFKSCKFLDSNTNARFDFYVNNQYLIEYDGNIHYYHKNTGWNNEKNFKKIQEHDVYKNKWCKDNNIPLIRIPYTHLNDLKIEDLLLETSEYIVK